jgi:hypothetical protein
VADLDFTEYALKRLAEREVPIDVVRAIVEDADEIIRRDDGRIDYVGHWAGGPIRVVADGDVEDDERILIINVITNRRGRRSLR